MAIRDVLAAARTLQEAFDQLDALQSQKAALVAQRDGVQAKIDLQQPLVDAARQALKDAAATL